MSDVTHPADVVTPETLQAFADAWNNHDLDGLMAFMTDDCVYNASAGPELCGASFSGLEDVRAGYAKVFEAFPDAKWKNGKHFVNGDRGASEWVFEGTMADGTRVESNGCDLFVFRDGKIQVKDSFRKNVIK